MATVRWEQGGSWGRRGEESAGAGRQGVEHQQGTHFAVFPGQKTVRNELRLGSLPYAPLPIPPFPSDHGHPLVPLPPHLLGILHELLDPLPRLHPFLHDRREPS